MKKLFRKFFAKTIKEEQKSPVGTFVVQEIVPGSKSMIEGLGITEERAGELTGYATSSYHGSKNLCEAMNKASQNLVHANELFFVSHIIHAIHQKHQGIGSMMEMLFRGGK